MPRITRSALVMFSAEQMFRLVNDVDAYPEFLPGCVGSRVHESGEDYMSGLGRCGQGRYRQDLYHAQPARCQPPPSRWSWWRAFQQAGGMVDLHPWTWMPAKVEFDLDFRVHLQSSLSWPLARIFRELVSSMVLAFSNRAKVVYGV